MVEIGYDANQLPLGKLSKAHIKVGVRAVSSCLRCSLLDCAQRGYKVLTQIAEALEEDAS